MNARHLETRARRECRATRNRARESPRDARRRRSRPRRREICVGDIDRADPARARAERRRQLDGEISTAVLAARPQCHPSPASTVDSAHIERAARHRRAPGGGATPRQAPRRATARRRDASTAHSRRRPHQLARRAVKSMRACCTHNRSDACSSPRQASAPQRTVVRGRNRRDAGNAH